MQHNKNTHNKTQRNVFGRFLYVEFATSQSFSKRVSVRVAGMSIYMAFFVLLLLFEANMPPASEGVPILGRHPPSSVRSLLRSLK